MEWHISAHMPMIIVIGRAPICPVRLAGIDIEASTSKLIADANGRFGLN